jgi:hypothetical protein
MCGFPNEVFMLIGGFHKRVYYIYKRLELKFCSVADFLQATRPWTIFSINSTDQTARTQSPDLI